MCTPPANRAELEAMIAKQPAAVAANAAALRAPLLSWAAEFLGEWCPSEAQPALDAAWVHERPFVREGAVLGASAMLEGGSETPRSRAILEAALSDPSPVLRQMAAGALEVA